jgi:hypothetical protein
VGAGHALCLGHVARLGHDLHFGLGVDQHPQPLADDGVIVGDHDGRLVAVRGLGAHAAPLADGRAPDTGPRRLCQPLLGGMHHQTGP